LSRTARAAAALVCVVALPLAGCTTQDGDDKPGSTPSSASQSPSESPVQYHPDIKACLLTISGGFQDKAFSAAASEGLRRAGRELGVRTAAVPARPGEEYADALDTLAQRGCDVVTTVSYLLGDATRVAAKQNPGVDYSIVDFSYDRPPDNLKGLLFDSASPAFLAGYLAAGVSESGIVGTFGGAQIPSVTVYMDGFQAGVDRYNQDTGADVVLLGWDKDAQKGTFTNDFESRTKAQSVASEMITQGADVIFPVAGAAGLGALHAVQEAGVRAIWPDTDGCVSAPKYCDVLLTSVMKRMDVAVYESIKDSAEGTFDKKTYEGTLQNGGVGLAPYHQQQDAVPSELDAQVKDLQQQIVAGDLEVR